MPKMDGFEVCRQLESDDSLPFMPVILLTALSDTKDIVTGLDAGAMEYLTKPVDHTALLARVRSLLRTKALHDQVQEQAVQLQEQSEELTEWNRTLKQRVEDQLTEIQQMDKLKSFLPRQVADLVVSSGDQALESHRRDVTVVFCDLRGFTAFSETAEPEEVMKVLDEHHVGLGGLIREYEGTLERFIGDGLMVLFNDPVPCDEPAVKAVRMSVAMRDSIGGLAAGWRKAGHDLGFGVGVAHGYATLGSIGFEGRFHYTAIGTVANLAARLCDEAKDGQVLVDGKVRAAVEELANVELVDEFTLKGLHRPVPAFNITGLK